MDGSYRKRLQQAVRNGIIKPEMVQIANNIQDIHNSLKTEMMENILTNETEAPEIIEEQKDDTYKMTSALQDQINNLLASSSKHVCNDGNLANIHKRHYQKQKSQPSSEMDPATSFGQIKNVFEYPPESEPKNEQSNSKRNEPNKKFRLTTQGLNSLVMRTFLYEKSPDVHIEGQPGTEETKSPWRIQPNGTWKSIVAWGRVAQLDRGQQVAFEILASTFVLSFVDDLVDNEEMSELLRQETSALELLSRKQKRKNKSALKLFITGPAGAGKCKFPYFMITPLLSVLLYVPNANSF